MRPMGRKLMTALYLISSPLPGLLFTLQSKSTIPSRGISKTAWRAGPTFCKYRLHPSTRGLLSALST